MKRRVVLELRCGSSSDASAVRDDLAAWLATRPRWTQEASGPTATQDESGWTVVADCPFLTAQNADDLMARVQQRWNSGPLASRILAGSSVGIHDCRHDEGSGACVETRVVK